MGFVGILLLLGTVLSGFLMEGGRAGVRIQPAEVVIIMGAALGSVLISTPLKVILQILHALIKVLTRATVSKAQYFELLSMLYELFQRAHKDGQLALEPHSEEPGKSSLFTACPDFINNHHAAHLLANTVRVILAGGVVTPDVLWNISKCRPNRSPTYAVMPTASYAILTSLLMYAISTSVLPSSTTIRERQALDSAKLLLLW